MSLYVISIGARSVELLLVEGMRWNEPLLADEMTHYLLIEEATTGRLKEPLFAGEPLLAAGLHWLM